MCCRERETGALPLAGHGHAERGQEGKGFWGVSGGFRVLRGF